MRRAKETLRGQAEEPIQGFLKKTHDERQKEMDNANRRGGRGRRGRKKTISDMSGMMAGPALHQAMADVKATVDIISKRGALAPIREHEHSLREPTKPGEFRKTSYDPFQTSSSFKRSSSCAV